MVTPVSTFPDSRTSISLDACHRGPEDVTGGGGEGKGGAGEGLVDYKVSSLSTAARAGRSHWSGACN